MQVNTQFPLNPGVQQPGGVMMGTGRGMRMADGATATSGGMAPMNHKMSRSQQNLNLEATLERIAQQLLQRQQQNVGIGQGQGGMGMGQNQPGVNVLPGQQQQQQQQQHQMGGPGNVASSSVGSVQQGGGRVTVTASRGQVKE